MIFNTIVGKKPSNMFAITNNMNISVENHYRKNYSYDFTINFLPTPEVVSIFFLQCFCNFWFGNLSIRFFGLHTFAKRTLFPVLLSIKTLLFYGTRTVFLFFVSRSQSQRLWCSVFLLSPFLLHPILLVTCSHRPDDRRPSRLAIQ